MSTLATKILAGLTMLGTLLFLTGWTGWNADAAQEAIPCSSSSFTKALHKEYLAFVDAKVKLENWQSADYFARKAVAAASGNPTLPEDPSVWDASTKDMDELIAARDKLLALFAKNVRTNTPELAAVAQVKYDCWLEGKAQLYGFFHTLADRYPEKTESCRCDFYNTLTEIEKATNHPTP